MECVEVNKDEQETYCIVKFKNLDFDKVKTVFEGWVRRKEQLKVRYTPKGCRYQEKVYMLEMIENCPENSISTKRKNLSPPKNLIVIKNNGITKT